jgi:ribulose kinase
MPLELTSIPVRDLVSPAAAIVGSIAGAWWGARERMKADRIAELRESRKWRESSCNQTIAFLRSILAEMNILWRRYNDLLGRDVAVCAPHDIRNIFHTFSQDYFTVYHSSAAILGMIENADVSSVVIDAYLQAKAVIDIIQVISSENSEIKRLEDDMNLSGTTAAATNYYASRIGKILGTTQMRYDKLMREHEKFRALIEQMNRVVTAELAQLSHGITAHG